MANRIGVLGTGAVGDALANGFLQHGYEVMRGSRDPLKLTAWKAGAGAKASTGTFTDTARFGDIVVLAVKGSAAEAAVKLTGADNLAGKIVIDTTNPISDEPPQDGVLRYFTGVNGSLMEKLQGLAPQARFVKAFSCVGAPLMVNPKFAGTQPTMFICGNDDTAKSQVQEVLAKFGWETEDLGKAAAARAIEPLAILWCIPGFLQNRWGHALKLLVN